MKMSSFFFHNETRSGGYLGHGWEGIGNRDMKEKGIVARDCRSLRRGQPRATIPFSISWFSLYLVFIHNIIPRRKQLLTVKIYIILHCKHERMVPRPLAAQGRTHQTLTASKNGTFVESSLWEWLVVAVFLHHGWISWTSSNTVYGAHWHLYNKHP